jgi:hypothetical protein
MSWWEKPVPWAPMAALAALVILVSGAIWLAWRVVFG